jgi:hypothetical protein
MPITRSHAKYEDFLRDEYLKLHDIYEDFDKRALSIKGWISGGAVAAMAVAFGVDVPAYREVIPWFVIALAATFWALEAGWKLYQQGYRDRIRVLEAYFRGDPDIIDKTPTPFQTYGAWYRGFVKDEPIYPYEELPPTRDMRPRSLRWLPATPWPLRPQWMIVRYLKIALYLNVMLPYAVIIALAWLSLGTLDRAQADAAARAPGVATVAGKGKV